MSALPTARADEYRALLAERLPDKTLRHCVSVAEYMVSIAEVAGIEPEQAVTAGLLHDLCKAMQGPELIRAAERYEIAITPLHRKVPTLLHGPVAAEECRRDLGLEDTEVYDAICWHTTGKANWNRVGLALYVADFSEPLRTMSEAAEVRTLLTREGFDAALRFVVDTKVAYVRERFTLDPDTKAFAEWVRSEWT